METDNTDSFGKLTPSLILEAIEQHGYITDGRLFPLNSYENRVYQIGIQDKTPIIAKFYRRNRWSTQQILEEHQFCLELAENELPVIPPLQSSNGDTLHEYQQYQFALYPRQGGHAPELDQLDNLTILGRLMGRIHLIGAVKPFQFRPTLDNIQYGHQSIQYITENFIPMELKTAYTSLCKDLMAGIDNILESCNSIKYIRTHSDCHSGNILWRDNAPHIVDFDDARMAPAIQDLWMLLSGDQSDQLAQLSKIMDGYQEFNYFNPQELQLVEALRSLRILHYSAWLAKRWVDPAFPHSFPWFNTPNYWNNHILELREQMAAINEPPLHLL